ncbi:thiamine-phosphate kinase [Candidatus Nitrosotenuis uzonensis]|uniref:Thiamine-monophosphate kinase n=1 Tax=Candidatus Nitrosotenuis uzonensis TaxID=1407055 RepID=A0A812F0E8_9ARCH|nr:thiamine-phosphate kinase [Candidatus Nitrosotenuis uzonensis]MCA2003357.1 thiamine-phosphate kinase [Candidatus Nitrosotenuis sp.]CAE6495231.1 Thiamine-monophosphate kinase [Candidatus Nitrosotenuis uzonensis]
MTRLDEKQIISLFQRIVSNRKHTHEDVETFRIGRKFGVLKTDTLVFSTDVPPGMKLEDVARKSVVACVSDFAAKGVRPLYCLVSISIPRSFSRSHILRLARGFRTASKEFGVRILGGDTNEAKELVISVTMFGVADKIVRRSGAKAGDSILVTGRFGRTSAGLEIILGKRKSDKKFASLAKRSVYHAVPRLEFGIDAAKYMTSAMDSSDGLSTTLVEMSAQSKKKFLIVKLPADTALDKFARMNSMNPLSLIFNGGEEYEIVITARQKDVIRIKQIAKKNGVPLTEIGHVQNGSGVFLQGHKAPIRDLGWKHFSN